ncbi:MAG TPA: 2-phospho-L-lactate guanylyltransferase [Candidatus Acidoferrum sp.]|nr:2-phospho-L-lactate guanylyltransferase [Candidatus Acidoferrum sp.]
MRALLLPIKDLKYAKKRLTGVLTPEKRFGLADAMLKDTFHAVQCVRGAEKIFVITNYEPAMRVAEENGWEILREERQISESDSVDAASKICEERGVSGLLRVPLDVPLVQAGDIDDLLAIECEEPALVIVPSRDGLGTNAILRMPPTLFPSHFGEGSFAKHVGEAERLGARVILRKNVRLEMDVDDESDLRILLQHDLSGTETGRWLRESGVEARFRLKRAAGAGLAAKS